jgi:hypothetical protein
MLSGLVDPSSLLLCAVSLNNTAVEISETFIQDLFSHFGPINRISFNESPPITEALIQFCDSASVDQALSTFGSVSLHFGRITTLRPSAAQIERFFSPHISVPSLDKFKDCANSESSLLQKDSINSDAQGQSEKNADDSIHKGLCQKTMPSPKDNFSQEDLLFSCDHTTQPLTGADAFGYALVMGQNLLEFEPYLLTTNQKIGLIFLEGINSKIVTPKVLMNLCCCFGNVGKILVKPATGRALIQFNSPFEAMESIAAVNGMQFFGKVLRCILLTGRMLQFSRKAATTMNSHRALFGDYTFYRYQDSLNIKYNPPTNTLHLTNISCNCDEVVLFMILSQINEPVQIVRLAQRGKGGSLMYLAVFQCVQHAMEVLAVLHNKVIDGKSIKASFSRPRK